MADSAYSLTSSEPHYSMVVEIEDLLYAFRFLYQEREGFWYLSILDESETISYREGRKVLPIGDWLEVDSDSKLSVAHFRRLYDLADGLFPGVLLAVSSRPLQRVREDADDMRLEYVSAETLDGWIADALEAAA